MLRRARRRRYLLAAAIAGFWLAMMVLLVRREVLVPTLQPGAGTAPDAPSDVWLQIRAGADAPVGYVNLQAEPEARGEAAGTRHRLRARMDVSLMGYSANLTILGNAWSPRLADEPGEFEFTLRSGGHDLSAAGVLEKGRIAGHLITGGETVEFSLPVGAQGPFMGSGFDIDPREMEPGKVYEMDGFDMAALGPGKTRVRLIGQRPLALHGEDYAAWMLTVNSGGFTTRVWVDDEGGLLMAETPFGLTLERVPPEKAILAGSGDAGDIVDLTGVLPSGARPFPGAARMTARVRVEQRNQELPADASQRVRASDDEPGVFLVEVAPRGPSGHGAGTPDPDDGGASLEADILIQSDNPRIVEKAARIVGGAQAPWDRARLLGDWVYENVEKEPVLSLPSALEVLQNLRGDCNEHTVLFVALARAAGVPARIALGLVWSDRHGRFGYHAWPEVFVEGSWVWMDPTLGQYVADAARVKLLTGNAGQWPRIASFAGQVEVEVVDIE